MTPTLRRSLFWKACWSAAALLAAGALLCLSATQRRSEASSGLMRAARLVRELAFEADGVLATVGAEGRVDRLERFKLAQAGAALRKSLSDFSHLWPELDLEPALQGSTVDFLGVVREVASATQGIEPLAEERSKRLLATSGRAGLLGRRLEGDLQTAGEDAARDAEADLAAAIVLALLAMMALGGVAWTWSKSTALQADGAVASIQGELRDAQRQYQMIESAIDSARKAQSAHEAIHAAAEKTRELLDWSLAQVLVRDPEDGAWVSTRRWFGEREELAAFRRVAETVRTLDGDDGPGRAAATGLVAWQVDGELGRSGLRSRLCTGPVPATSVSIPIGSEQDIVAVIELLDRRARAPEESLTVVLDHLAYQLQLICEREAAGALIRNQERELDLRHEEIQGHSQELDRQRARLAEAQCSLEQQAKELSETFESLQRSNDEAHQARALHEFAARRFEELFSGLPVACFTCDRDGHAYEWNRSAETLWGHQAFEVLDRSVTELVVAPRERKRFRAMLRSVFKGKRIDQAEVATIHASGETVWALVNGFPMRTADGTISGSVWTFTDTTERKLQAMLLKENEERFRTSLEAMQSGVMLFDLQGRVILINPKAEELLGWTRAQLESPEFRLERLQPITITGAAIPREQLPTIRSLHLGETCHHVVLGVQRSDGALIYISANSAPFFSGGKVSGVVLSFVDITQQLADEATIRESMEQIHHYSQELEETNRKLEAIATTDGLTGLKNRRAFREFLDEHFAGAQRYGHPLSLAMIDVDHFKMYNDAFGHPAGDEVLRKVAAIASSVARTPDLVARYGGEEFVVVMPATGAAGALEAAERMREAIAATPFDHRAITVSLGVATLAPDIGSPDELVELADRALYVSKSQGRNRTVLADSRSEAA